MKENTKIELFCGTMYLYEFTYACKLHPECKPLTSKIWAKNDEQAAELIDRFVNGLNDEWEVIQIKNLEMSK